MSRRKPSSKKIGWIYFYCIHGPGHQGTSDGLLHFDVPASDKEVTEKIEDRMADKDSPIIYWWWIKSPSKQYILSRIEDADYAIKHATEQKAKYEAMLHSHQGPENLSEPGADEAIIDAAASKIEYSIHEQLIKRGICINHSTVP